MTPAISDNIRTIQARIDAACLASGRKSAEVKLLLATKTVSPVIIREALSTGYTLIAENRIQELKDKFDALADIPHTNHFIGHLQTNKIKEILRYNVTCIHSLDRYELAEKLNQRLAFESKQMDVLIQVNTSREESKFGVEPAQALEFVRRVAELTNLHIRGLMTIGMLSTQTGKVRDCFHLLKQIQQQIKTEDIPGVSMQELSMGMSGDLEIAVEEGATIIRVGTAIFGSRSTPDSFYWNENR